MVGYLSPACSNALARDACSFGLKGEKKTIKGKITVFESPNYTSLQKNIYREFLNRVTNEVL